MIDADFDKILNDVKEISNKYDGYIFEDILHSIIGIEERKILHVGLVPDFDYLVFRMSDGSFFVSMGPGRISRWQWHISLDNEHHDCFAAMFHEQIEIVINKNLIMHEYDTYTINHWDGI